MTFFKVWSCSGVKKAVVVSDLATLVEQGCQKLQISNEGVKAYLEDGTEIDDDLLLLNIPAGSIIYLLGESDMPPWIKFEGNDSPLTEPNESLGTTELNSSTDSSSLNISSHLNIKKHPWPKDFDIPSEQFSSTLTKALAEDCLQWTEKSELLNHLALRISKYTDNPSATERKQVAQKLILMFPKLSSCVGEGWHGWSNKIYDKMREVRRKKRASTIGMKRKIPNDGIDADPKSSMPQKFRNRGEINWAPDAPEGEDSISLKANREWLQKEFKKESSVWNKQLIKEKMELTFSDRRALINGNNKSLSSLKEFYPFLFTCNGIVEEFSLLMAIDIDKTILSELNEIAPYILKISEERKKKKDLLDILKTYNSLPEKHINDKLVACLLILPLLISDKPEMLYNVYPTETSIEKIKLGPTTPHVAVIGSPYRSSLVFIVAENEILIEGVEFVQSVISTLSLYYCCNIKYPVKGSGTYTFIELKLLKLKHGGVIPRKIVTLCEKLNKFG